MPRRDSSEGAESIGTTSEALTFTEDFYDGFDGTGINTGNRQNQDEIWVNAKSHCYDNGYNEGGGHKTLDVSGGTVKIRVVDSGNPNNPWAVTVADLNGDGHPDLAVANLYGYSVSVLLNVGGGALMSATDYAVGKTPESVVAADLNGDGRLDLATANEITNDMTVLFNQGNGTFGAPVSYPAAGYGPSSIVAADMNGDGHADLAIANQYGDSVSMSTSVNVFLNRGSGTFDAARVYYRTGANPRSIAAADLNADGRPDLAIAQGNSVTLLMNASLLLRQ